jgi:hypothetical protein
VTSNYEPTDDERILLAQVLEMPGWEVVQKIAVAAVAEFRDIVFKLNPLNADYAAQVVESCRRADTAQTLWEGIAQRIEKQIVILNQPKPKGTKPTISEAIPDLTEEMNL